MTQYPSPPPHQPYQPYQPNYYGDPNAHDPLVPARRASILMYVLGALTILGSLCCGGFGIMVPKLMTDRPDVFAQANLPAEATPGMVQSVFIVLAVLILLFGVAYTVLGYFVGKGGKGSIITAMVLTILGLLYLAANLIGSLLLGARGGSVDSIGGICVTIVPLTLFILLLVWLVQALRNSSQASAAAYGQQYWQYPQQYGQYPAHPPAPFPPPAGYGAPPPAPQPGAVPPPLPGEQAAPPQMPPPPDFGGTGGPQDPKQGG